MKRTLLACLFLLPGCNDREPDDEGADDAATSDADDESSESAGDGDTTTGDGDGDTTTGDGDGDTTTGDGDGDTTTGDGDGDTCPPVENCDELLTAFQAETVDIRGCSMDEQCGQVLQGTSCGCTRNWVARLDADTTCFYALIDQAGVLECDLPLISTCDCPEADGFVCNEGICSWNYL